MARDYKSLSLQEASKWYRNNTRKLAAEKKAKVPHKFESGNIYLYRYDPKTKDTLPYYDTLPVVLVLSLTNDGFYGLNFHYLPPASRLILLRKMQAFKLKSGEFLLDHSKIKNLDIFSEHEPTFKRYLFSHIRSNIRMIPVEDWKHVVSLSLESFVKATKEEVWGQ